MLTLGSLSRKLASKDARKNSRFPKDEFSSKNAIRHFPEWRRPSEKKFLLFIEIDRREVNVGLHQNVELALERGKRSCR